HHAVPLGLFLALARSLVAPLLRRRQRQVGDSLARVERTDLRVLAQISDQNDLVDAACHRRLLFWALAPDAGRLFRGPNLADHGPMFQFCSLLTCDWRRRRFDRSRHAYRSARLITRDRSRYGEPAVPGP